jgi:hypothetical protein
VTGIPNITLSLNNKIPNFAINTETTLKFKDNNNEEVLCVKIMTAPNRALNWNATKDMCAAAGVTNLPDTEPEIGCSMCPAAANDGTTIAFVDCKADDGTEFGEDQGITTASTEQNCKDSIQAAGKAFGEYNARSCKEVNEYMGSGDGNNICPGGTDQQAFVHFSSRCGCPITDDSKCGSEHNVNDTDCCAPNGEEMWCHDGYIPKRTGEACSNDPDGMFTCSPPSCPMCSAAANDDTTIAYARCVATDET